MVIDTSLAHDGESRSVVSAGSAASAAEVFVLRDPSYLYQNYTSYQIMIDERTLCDDYDNRKLAGRGGAAVIRFACSGSC